MKIYKMIISAILLVVLIAATIYCLLNTGYAVHNGVVYNDNAQYFMVLAGFFGMLLTFAVAIIISTFKDDQEDDDE